MSYKTILTLFLLTLLTFSVELVASVKCRMAGNYKVEKIPGSKVGLGEGPHWDIPSQSLYYIDMYAGTLCRYSSKEHKVYKCKIENEALATFMIPIEGQLNNFVVGCGRNLSIVEWNGSSESCKVKKVLTTVEESFPENRFNDAKCDPWGRLFAGTMRHTGDIYKYRDGNFYKYNNGKMEVVFTNIGISNGLTWDTDRNLFYYVDSLKYNCLVYEYDSCNGTVLQTTGREFATNIRDENDQTLLPDGMTITSEGLVLISVYNGGKLMLLDRQGNLKREFLLPVKLTTSVAFGGRNLDELYVTSKADDTEDGGSMYRITGTGLKGLPMSNCKI